MQIRLAGVLIWKVFLYAINESKGTGPGEQQQQPENVNFKRPAPCSDRTL